MPSLPHQLLLLELDDLTGRSLLGLDSLRRNYALAGAVLSELQLSDRLVAVGADAFLLASGAPSEGALGLAEARLPHEPRSIQRLVMHLSSAARSSWERCGRTMSS